MRKALLVSWAIALVGCATSGSMGRKPDAAADLMTAGGKKIGTAALFDEKDKVRLVVDVTGLDPGKHGIHFHAVGQCQDPAFTTAGPHFNPVGKKHGLDAADGPHAGDLPNLEADKDGKALQTPRKYEPRDAQGNPLPADLISAGRLGVQ